MAEKINRRKFFRYSTQAGIAGYALLMVPNFHPVLASNPETKAVPDPKNLNYCGYKCPDDCKFLKATKENDNTLKLDAFNTWKIKETYRVDFNPETMICWGCKTKDKPIGFVIAKCGVRKCCIEKGYNACIQCETLNICEQDLWKRFPDFHTTVMEMRKSYLAAQ